jgi:hypothetical protein
MLGFLANTPGAILAVPMALLIAIGALFILPPLYGRGRTRLLRATGIGFGTLMAEGILLLAIRSMDTDTWSNPWGVVGMAFGALFMIGTFAALLGGAIMLFFLSFRVRDSR